MATKFTWEITSYEVTDRVTTFPANHEAGSMVKETETGIITRIHWKLTGTNKGESVSHYGFVIVPDAKEQDLLKVEDKQLIKTVQEILGGDVIAAEQANIEEHLIPSYK